jgi:hypothetical protein
MKLPSEAPSFGLFRADQLTFLQGIFDEACERDSLQSGGQKNHYAKQLFELFNGGVRKREILLGALTSSGLKPDAESARTNDAVWERGREIFEREKHRNEVWGNSAARQTHTFPQRHNPEALTLTVIGESRRARYLEIARAELQSEATSHAASVS